MYPGAPAPQGGGSIQRRLAFLKSVRNSACSRDHLRKLDNNPQASPTSSFTCVSGGTSSYSCSNKADPNLPTAVGSSRNRRLSENCQSRSIRCFKLLAICSNCSSLPC